MKEIRILHIEDDLNDCFLIERELKKANILFTHNIVSSRQEFLNMIDADQPDIILSDHSLPNFNSFEALDIVKKKDIKVPFILITGNTSEDFAISVIKEGADDFILKDRMQRLPSAILNAIDKFNSNNISLQLLKERQEKEKAAIIEINRLNERLQLATKSAGIGIWDWDILNNHLSWDDEMCRLYNINADYFESAYESWMRQLHPEDRQLINEEIQLAIEGKKEYNTEFRIIHQDASIHYLKATATVQRNIEGAAIRMTGVNWDITEQKKEEQHLKLLESVITHANESVMITEAEPFDGKGHRIVYVNKAFTEMTGYDAGEVIGKTPKILQGQKSDKDQLDHLSQALKKWEPCDITIINYKKNGEPFWIYFSVNPVADGSGRFSHWIAIQKDVTVNKNAELQKQLLVDLSYLFNGPPTLNEIMRGVLDRITVFIDCHVAEAWLVGKDKRRIHLAAKSSRSANLDAFYAENGQLIGFDKGESLPGIIWQSKTVQFWRNINEQQNFTGKGASKNEELESAVGLPIIFNNEVIGVLILRFKSSEQMNNIPGTLFQKLEVHMGNEIKRKQLEQELNQIFRFAPDFVCIVDLRGHFVKINPAGCQLLEYSEEELMMGPLADFVHPEDRERTIASIRTVRKSLESYSTENRFITKSGTVKWFSWTSSRLQEEGLIYAVGKDITEKKLSEMHLKELNIALRQQADELATSNADLEQFAFVASHDLQEPLRMVTSFLTLLESKYGNLIDAKGKKYIDFAVDGSRRMRHIILDLLEYSRIGRTDDKQTNVDLNELLNEIQILFREEISRKNAIIRADPLPVIHGFKTPLRQVFQNLIGNALKFTLEGKAVHIKITVINHADDWQFAIADNGIGIAEHHFQRIFEIFQRLHTKEIYYGTGMGLALVKKIIEKQGGKIWLESKIGKGTTFYFTLRKHT